MTLKSCPVILHEFDPTKDQQSCTAIVESAANALNYDHISQTESLINRMNYLKR